MSEKLLNLRCHIHGFGHCDVSPPNVKPIKEASAIERRHRDKEEIESQMEDMEGVPQCQE